MLIYINQIMMTSRHLLIISLILGIFLTSSKLYLYSVYKYMENTLNLLFIPYYVLNY